MKQFEDEEIAVELHERRDRRMAEAGRGRFDHRLQFAIGEGSARVRRDDRLGYRRIGLAGEIGDRLPVEKRNPVRHIEAAVAGKARQKRRGEVDMRRAATGRSILHVKFLRPIRRGRPLGG